MANIQERLPCGCILQHHQRTGSRSSVSKCSQHRRAAKDPIVLNERYYKGLGTLTESGEINLGKYLQEFEEGMGQPVPVALPNSKAIEIGGGVSPYASMLVERGYAYTLIEPSYIACEIMKAKVPGITTYPCLFPEQLPTTVVPGTYDVVLSAHSLEHMKYAINALWHMGQLLSPKGVLYLLIPNDDDLGNSDHLWFFNETSIRRTATVCQLSLESLKVKQIVPHEKFMYCVMQRMS